MSGSEAERSFGALLRAARLGAALTQQDLATRCGMSVRAISDLERNRTRRPYLRSVRLLAEALNVPRPLRDAMLAASRYGEQDGHLANEAGCVAGDQPDGQADPRASGTPEQVGTAASACPADQLPGVLMDFAGLPVAVQVSVPLVVGGRPGMPTVCQNSSAGLWHEMRSQAELLAVVAEQLVEAVAKTAALAEALTDLRAHGSRTEGDHRTDPPAGNEAGG